MASPEDKLKSAMALLRQGDAAGAFEAARTLAAEAPDYPDAWLLAGQAAHVAGDMQAAAQCLERVSEMVTGSAVLFANLAAVQLAQGLPEAARLSANRGIQCHPEHFGAQLNAGLANLALGFHREAVTALEKALELNPDSRVAGRAFAVASYRAGGAHLSARPLLQKALEHDPADHEVAALLADSFIQTGDTEVGLRAFEALITNANHIPAEALARYHSSWLIAQQYDPNTSAQDLFKAHKAWADQYAPSEVNLPRQAAHVAPAKIRIGWLSPRFGGGPLASFLLPVLEAMDPDQCEMFFYATYSQSDLIHQRFRQLPGHWREIADLGAREAAELISADAPDVLIDLAGHAPGGHLAALACKPAPVQISWLDAFCTSGLSQMDVFLSDAELSPEGDEAFFTEKLIRLPTGRMCYRPQMAVPENLNHDRSGPVVFGCFNRLSKIGPTVLESWAAILNSVSDSSIRIRNSIFDDPQVLKQFQVQAKQHGLSSDQLSLHGSCSYPDIMRDYAHVDVVLDPFPFSGCTTTCDALWMGLPVVTLAGNTLVSRQSAAILRQLGHAEWVARTQQEYQSIAAGLAADNELRAELKSSLRAAMTKSFEPRRFARELMATVRGLTA